MTKRAARANGALMTLSVWKVAASVVETRDGRVSLVLRDSKRHRERAERGALKRKAGRFSGRSGNAGSSRGRDFED